MAFLGKIMIYNIYTSTMSDSAKNCLKKPTNSDKWRFTLYTVIILLLVFNPYTYILVNKLLADGLQAHW